MTDRSGYSFIEMLTVFIVLGLMLAITMVTMAPSISRAKVHNAANIVAGDLQYASLLAVRHREPIAFIVVPATRQYIIRERDDATKVYRRRSLGDGTDFSLETFTSSQPAAELYPNGVVGQMTDFVLRLNGYERTVRLTRAGQVRILR